MLALQVDRAQGAHVIVSGAGIDSDPLQMALNLGAEETLDASSQDLNAVVKRVTNGEGVDVVLECAGSASAVDAGLHAIRKAGQFTQVGLFGKPVTIDFERICFKEIKTIGSTGSKRIPWEAGIRLVENGEVQTHPLVSHGMPTKN